MKLLLRYPHFFGYNEETAGDNEFQQNVFSQSSDTELKAAQAEFQDMVELLRKNDLDLIIMDEEEPSTSSPDALFPNNWFSTHPEGFLFTYPMLATNRRTELNSEFIRSLGSYIHIPLEHHSEQGIFLEGTGSLILDREAKCIYASRSERTHEGLLHEVAEKLNYDRCVFDAFSPSGKAIYHTNVVMHIGKDYICAGTDLIPESDRNLFKEQVKRSEKVLIELASNQVMEHFAGNMLQVISRSGKRVLLLSENAHRSLDKEQIASLSEYNDVILPIPIPTIERIGGGSVRCMVAEIY